MDKVMNGETFINDVQKLGILGGGQLGKILIQTASRYHVRCAVLDPSSECPASEVNNEITVGSFSDYQDVMNFGKNMDILTIEIENVNTEALRELRSMGKIVRPSPESLEIIKDKGKQKDFYLENDIPTSKFKYFEGREQIIKALDEGEIQYPFVQKLCREGYDGRGVSVIDGNDDLEDLLSGESIVEKKVLIDMEISVIVSRNDRGEVNVFPPVEMEFEHEANLVDMLIAPARLAPGILEQAGNLGKKVVERLELVGVMAVEMFLDEKGNLLVNESAPRPHNSGHHTIEANHSSQYDQHLRAILGMPLGNCEMVQNAVLINLLGSKDSSGLANYSGLDEVWKTSGAHLHIYGKKESKPFRKMGHVTICGIDLKSLVVEARRLKNKVTVGGQLTEN